MVKEINKFFHTMSYNETPLENSSTILSWIQSQNETLDSISNGKSFGGGKNSDSFSFSDKKIQVNYLGQEDLELLAKKSYDSMEIGEENAKRISRLKEVVKGIKYELCFLEASAFRVPFSQVLESDFVEWIYEIDSTHTHQIHSGPRKCFFLIELSREGSSSTSRLLSLILSLVCYEKIKLLITTRSEGDLACFLPLIYLIQQLNAKKVWSLGIDVGLLDQSSLKCLSKSTDLPIFLCGTFLNPSIRGTLYSGVFRSCEKISGVNLTEYILDSGTDSKSALETIVTDIWSLGTKLNSFLCPILYVDEGSYAFASQFFEKRLSEMKSGLDFIPSKRAGLDIVNNEGLKVIPSGSNLERPSVVTQVGTGSEFLTHKNLTRSFAHILLMFPYRNRGELLQLTNSYGDESEIFIFSSDQEFIREISEKIKGQRVTVNSNRREIIKNSLEMKNLRLLTFSPSLPHPLSSQNPAEFKKLVLGGESCQKIWLNTKTRKERAQNCGAALWSLIKNDSQKNAQILIEFMSFALSGMNYKTKASPFGVVGIIFCNPPQDDNLLALPILLTASKGNSVIVLNAPEKFVKNFNEIGENFPEKLIQFSNVENTSDAVESFSTHCEKIRVIWIINWSITAGNNLMKLDENLPIANFSKVIVDDGEDLVAVSRNRAQLLEQSKLINF